MMTNEEVRKDIKAKIKEKKENGFVEINDEEKKDLEKIAGLKFENMWIGQ